MPNHITNIINVEGNAKEIEKFLKKVKSKESIFDFEKIVPMPKRIHRGDLSLSDEEKYGKENCWYYWSIKNWGTKWNAYNFESSDGEIPIKFDTAWSTPLPVFEELGAKFPKLKFTIEYADEDFGGNCGRITIEKGNVDIWRPTYFTDEAYALAAKVKGYDPREEEYE